MRKLRYSRMRLRRNIFKWNIFSKIVLFLSQKYLATGCLPFKKKKKGIWEAGCGRSLISHPDVYELRSSSLPGESRGVPNDGSEWFLSPWHCPSLHPMVMCTLTPVPMGDVHLNASPHGDSGQLENVGSLQGATQRCAHWQHSISDCN